MQPPRPRSFAALFCAPVLALVVASVGACRPAAAAETPRAPAAAAAPSSTRAVRVDVWHDTVCPWCRIGLHNLDTALRGLEDTRVDVVHHAFELDPTTPPEGADLRARLGAKYGADKIDAMFARVTDVGASYGLTFRFDKVTRTPNTLASHALVAWAPEDARARLLAAVHRAYFEEGRDIGDADVLASLAAAVGLDAAAARTAVTDPERLQAVRDAARAASVRGVRSVPHFEIDGRVLRGAQSPAALRDAIAGARGRPPSPGPG